MFHIEKALKKARDSEPKRVIQTSNALDGIAYTQTRVESVSVDDLKKNRIVAGLREDPHNQLFRNLRTHVLKQMQQKGWTTIGITSPGPGEGKTMVTANLAVALAMDLNQSVLLVDLDLRNPSLAKIFGIHCDMGVGDFLQRKASLSEVMVNPGIKRLVLVPGRESYQNSSELLSSPAMQDFIKDARSRYKNRVVIFDLPPILPTDDVLVATSYMDCALMVVQDGKSSARDLQRSKRLLQQTNLLGVVLNCASSGQKLPDYPREQ